MATQVTLFPTPLPDPYVMTSDELEESMSNLVGNLNPFAVSLNSLGSEVEDLALRAEVAAAALANAVWVSGTSYTAGVVRYSPIDFLMYRRKTNGAGTTDPSLDPTNWALQTKTETGGSDTTSSAVDIALTATSGRLQVISMTASGKKVTLPSASTVAKGSPIFVIKNNGLYRFAIRKNGGVFICYVNPGQVLAFGCSDTSTSAGIWTVSGGALNNIFDGNAPEVLNAVDSRYIAVAMLSATKAICCYKNNTSTFLNAVILNFGSASGTPLAVSAEAVRNISVAALSATQAVVVYQLTGTNSSVKGYVLDISGNTITPGAAQTIHTQANSGFEGTELFALSATKLLVLYMRGSSSNALERVLDVSGTTITASAEVTADAATANSNLVSIKGEKVSATKALVVFHNATHQVIARLQTITGSTPAPSGSTLTIPPPGTAQQYAPGLCVLSASRAVIVRSIERLYGDLIVYLLDISGTTPSIVATKHVETDLVATGTHVSICRLDDNHAYVTWPGAFNGVDAMTLTITNDDRIVIGEALDRIEPGVTLDIGYVSCDALDSTHVMQACRNASTFLSAKTVELSL